MRGESQSNVVDRPDALGVAQVGSQQVADLLFDRTALGVSQSKQERIAECIEPVGKRTGKRGWSRYQSDAIDREAARLNACAIVLGGRKKPRVTCGGIETVLAEDARQSIDHREDIAGAAELADKASAGPQCAHHTAKHPIRLGHPVQDRIGKHRV